MRTRLGIKRSEGTLGTFGGVFTPSILTILGIILFLRLGYVVGQAGLQRALVIIALANAISLLTSISLSAIATNIKVKGGGDYYLISRTLGVEFGGAIGMVLFLAQSVSVGFYCIGFGEVVAAIFPLDFAAYPQVVAAVAVSLLFVLAWLGADWATRFQYVVMATLGAALVAFFAGGAMRWDGALLAQNWQSAAEGPGFWVLFAIFFPAVTGFTQGVSMSGDLKDAGRSLPRGTLIAVGLSMVVYFAAAVVLSATVPGELLVREYGVMKQVALSSALVNAGVIAATLSSAMASFLGAPRILQSMAGDRIFPFLLPFAKGVGELNNPRRGVLLSGALAFATVGLGQLNLIAPIVSMFFLISYGLLNYATFYEARASSPSFRPRFRLFDFRLSLVGSLACLGTMLAIDPAAGAVALAVLFAIYQYLKRTAGPVRWADSRRSYHLQHMREHLIAAAAEPEHPRDWRPQILALSDNPERRALLLRFASWLEGQSGLTTAVRILEGEGVKMIKLREEAEAEIRKDIEKLGLKAFPLVVDAPNLNSGLHILLQSFGVGPLKANTILVNFLSPFPKKIFESKERIYGRNLREAFRQGFNIVILNTKEDAWNDIDVIPASAKQHIDVWWWWDATSRLMLLLAYLMTRSEQWQEAKIRLMAARTDESPQKTEDDLKKMLEEVRIEAQPIVVDADGAEAVAARSADASLVFLPFRIRRNQMLDSFGNPIEDILSRLPTVALALAAEDIDLDAEPEEGAAGDVAAAMDALSDAQKRTREAEKDVLKAVEAVKEKRHELEEARASGVAEEALKELESSFAQAEQSATKALRKAAKALAKEDDAERTLELLEERAARAGGGLKVNSSKDESGKKDG